MSEKSKIQIKGEKLAKQKAERDKLPKSKPGNNPIGGQSTFKAKMSDQERFMSLNAEMLTYPDIDFDDPEQVRERIAECFRLYGKYGMKVTMSGLGLMLNGKNRQEIWAIACDGTVWGRQPKVTPEVRDLIKKAYQGLEVLWETYMLNGKVNPAAGIFLGKNQFGYKDVTEQVIIPKREEEEYNTEDIKNRYLEDKD